jgi:tripartite ATP-independent transporter DctM subunit
MISLSPEAVTIIMFGTLLVGIIIGVPLAIVIGAIALGMGYAIYGSTVGSILYPRIFDVMSKYVFLAVPLFVFMGGMLERSGITEKMFDALYLWLGGMRGGLALTTVLLGTVLAACVGIIAASITMLALVALPAMMKRGYDKSLAAGSVCAGGCLGILIPPSVMLIIYGPMALISVGKLFMAAFFPGLLLSALYCIYIIVRSYLQPHLAPSVPAHERAGPLKQKTTMLLSSMVPPVLLVLAVLGSMFTGLASTTEAAGCGAFAATLLTIAYRHFNLKVLRETSMITLRLCGFIFLIIVMAYAFVGVFISAGGTKVVEQAILGAPGGRWGAFVVIMFIVFLLGFFIDWIGIVLIMVPIMHPIAANLGFDPLWFAMMVCVNLQTSFMTPPFATGVFITRGAADPALGVTMGDVIKGVLPFVALILVGLVLLVVFPEIILWLPAQMIK